jgi:hypothetical protein
VPGANPTKNSPLFDVPYNVIATAFFANYGTIDVQSNTLQIFGYSGDTVGGGSFTGAGTLQFVGGQSTVTLSGGVTSNVSDLEFANGTFQIEHNFTQNGAFDLGNANLGLTDGTNLYTMTVTGLATLEAGGNFGALTAGTLITAGGFSMPGSFTVSSATLENQGTATIAGSTLTVEETDGAPPLGIFQNDATGTVTISDVTADGSTSYGTITDVFSGDGGEVINAGTIDLEGEANGNTSAAPSIEVDSILNSGSIIAETGYVTLNDQTGGDINDNGGGAGTLQIDANAMLELGGPVANNTVLFSSVALADPQTLVIDDLAESSSIDGSQQQDFNATIAGFAPGDAIEIATAGMGNFTDIADAITEAYDSTDNTTALLLDDNGSLVATLSLRGNYAGDQFSVTQGSGIVSIETPCYCRGTLISTARGEVRVEDLTIGDRVTTLAGVAGRSSGWGGVRTPAALPWVRSTSCRSASGQAHWTTTFRSATCGFRRIMPCISTAY